MSVDATYPLTMGQLSVWRDVEKLPWERRWEANLGFGWDLQQECSADEVWNALGALGMRHEALRTTYVLDEAKDLRQRIATDDASAMLGAVRQGSADVADRAELEAEQIQRAFDVTTELPWRAWLLTSNGEPRQVLVIAHHLATDGAGLLVMMEDFNRILAGESLPAAGFPRELALQQRDGALGRIRAAEGYWRRTLSDAPRHVASAAPGEVIGATLHTGIPVSMAHQAAASVGVSATSLLVAAYYCALRKATSESKILMYSMSHNRFSPAVATMVTSQNQWVPLLAEYDDSEPFNALAKKLHSKAFNALKNGCYDPDAIARLRKEFDQTGTPADAGYHINTLVVPAGDPATESLATESVEPSRVEWYTPARATGPGFYLIARGLSSIDLFFRVNRAGFDKETLATCLTSIQDTLSGAVGLAHA